jgi:hypothetical protein
MKIISNQYQGPKWVFYVWWFITILTLGRSIAHIVLPDGGAMSIATIPLDQYSPAAQETIIAMFALWGLSQLLVGLVYVVVLVRHQSWIPFISLLLVLEYAIRIGLGFFKTVVTVNTAPGVAGNLPLLLIGVLLLIGSLRTSDRPSSDESTSG